MKNNQSGFAHSVIIILIAVLVVIGFAFWQVNKKNNDSNKSDNSNSSSSTNSESSGKIKNLGINLDYYEPETQSAGDVKFVNFDTKAGGLDAIFSEYGRAAAANNTMGAGRLNPQPTFIAPLGTKVHALIDGVVVNIPKLESGDYSVHMQAGNGGENATTFETEHVINVKVKVGDKVKAGDVIAEVSDYDAKNIAGMGILEIGVLNPGNPPKHSCTFEYLDDSIKSETLKKITALEDAWEKFVGDDNVYNQKAEVIPGCSTRQQIEG